MTDTYELPEVTDAQIDVLWEQYVGIGMGLQGRLFARAILLQHSLQMRSYGQECARVERERAAKVCEAIASKWRAEDPNDPSGFMTAEECAAAIRNG